MVTHFLERTGPYANQDNTGKTTCENATAELKSITWVTKPGKSWVTSMDEFLEKWDDLLESIHQDDIPEDKVRVSIMLQAIKPLHFQARIKAKMDHGNARIT